MNLIILLLAGFGLTNILVNGLILDPIRIYLFKRSNFLKNLLSCSMCTGFWVGIYIAFVASVVGGGNPLFYFLTLPFAVSGVSWILERTAVIIDTIAYSMTEEDKEED